MSGGEPGLGEPEIRAKISRAWNTSHIRECMGIGDVMSALWGECDDASGMHFCAQRHVAVELVDPVTGARVPWREGAEGEPVYTRSTVRRRRPCAIAQPTTSSCWERRANAAAPLQRSVA